MSDNERNSWSMAAVYSAVILVFVGGVIGGIWFHPAFLLFSAAVVILGLAGGF